MCRRAELREQSEDERQRAELENKQRNEEYTAKLSEIKGRDVKEMNEEVERRYIFLQVLYSSSSPVLQTYHSHMHHISQLNITFISIIIHIIYIHHISH